MGGKRGRDRDYRLGLRKAGWRDEGGRGRGYE